ncbi:MAG: hypothetical protein ILP11_01800 [Alphaproteobacteria bacterium]|nr:hypothetical protein [Alphaproteobacteria bacterium]
MSDIYDLEDETEGREAGRKSFENGEPAKYLRHPRQHNIVFKRTNDDKLVKLGYMSDVPFAAGYIQGREAAAREKEFKKALGKVPTLADKLKEEPSIDTTQEPYRIKGKLQEYPPFLTDTLTSFRQKENMRDGYAEGKKAHLAHQPCTYRIDAERQVWERPAGTNQWVPSSKPYVYVKGFLSGWNGQKAPAKTLWLSVKAETLVLRPDSDTPDVITESTRGWIDGARARSLYAPLTDVRPPYIFKNKKLLAYVTKDKWTTYYVPIESPDSYAYAVAFIKGWNKWANNNIKESKQVQPVRRARNLRQGKLSLIEKEHN